MTTPASTYRLQLHEGFTFDDSAAIVDYLAQLGVSHLYLSPVLQSAPGITHGYDGVDPTRIDEDRGGRPGFDRLLNRCRNNNMGLVLDIVPIHLNITSPLNPWWRSVLRLGPASPFAHFFDIDWNAPHAGGRVILPLLGRPLDEAIDNGELKLAIFDAEPCLTYFDNHWPLNPDSVARIIADSDPQAPDAFLARFSLPGPLRGLIAEQHYLPMFWKTGGTQVNYRRFFDIDSLAAVRVEDPQVFEQTHKQILELAALDALDGLRVDHPDGLRDPQAYFAQLAEKTGGLWTVAEKIL
ncbi:MAG: alpha-amylase family glycosyl hydrolase [Phycisphaerales bacterium]